MLDVCRQNSSMGRATSRRTLIALIGAAWPAFGQGQTTQKEDLLAKQPPLRVDSLPPNVSRYAKPLMDRLGKKGSERVTVSAALTLADNSRQETSWIWEFPGKVRMSRGGPAARVVFDPSKGQSRSLESLDDALLEMLSSDTPDTFLDNVQNGYVPRLLGERFRVPGGTGFGSTVDIFEHAIPVPGRNGGGSSVKHYMFDSQSGLLSRVAYHRMVEGRFSQVTTLLSDYQTRGGLLAPGRLVRLHGKATYLQVDLQATTWSAATADSTFQE